MTPFSASEKYEAIKREIGYRIFVYPRLIRTGKMTPDKAEYEINILKAIADDYEKQAASERLI